MADFLREKKLCAASPSWEESSGEKGKTMYLHFPMRVSL